MTFCSIMIHIVLSFDIIFIEWLRLRALKIAPTDRVNLQAAAAVVAAGKLSGVQIGR